MPVSADALQLLLVGALLILTALLIETLPRD
jgi:hypothetical protein